MDTQLDSQRLIQENQKLYKAVAQKSCELKAYAEELEAKSRALKQTQEQLLSACKLEAIGRLAAGIAHEINTPAQFLGDNLSFLQDAFQELLEVVARLCEGQSAERLGELENLREEIPAALESSQEGLRRINSIVAAMRRFSHPSAGTKSPTSLEDLVNTSLTVSASEWKYVAQIKTDFDSNLPPVPCIRDELSQVVLNLLVNAAYAIKEKGSSGLITIQTRREGDRAFLSVEDDGSGIPENVQTRIFEPFFTTKPVGKGTGQGLAMAYRVVVEKHGGRLSFESKPGQGTRFIIELPLA